MTTPKILTAAEIVAAEDIGKPELVEVPEWGGAVYIKRMSGVERDAFEEQCVRQTRVNQTNLRGLKAALLVQCLVLENGEPMFTNPADVNALNQKSGEVIDRLYKQAQELNGIGKDGEAKAEKNSPPAPSEDAGSN